PDERPSDLPESRRRHWPERHRGGDLARSRGHATRPARARARARMTGFTRDGASLVGDGVSLEAAAAEHGTPLYVYSRDAIVEAYRSYQTAFAPVPHRVCYA